MNRTRKLAMVVGSVAVAMGLGHVLQGGLPGSSDSRADLETVPRDIQPLAAGLGQAPDTALRAPAEAAPPLTPEAMQRSATDAPDRAAPESPVAADPVAADPVAADAVAEGATTQAPATETTMMDPSATASEPSEPAEADAPGPEAPRPDAAPVVVTDGAAPDAAPAPETPVEAAQAALSGDSVNCPTDLQLLPDEGATLLLDLLAPCRSAERVVILHGGLAFTGKTSLSGALSVTFPAMEQSGAVTLRFPDGTELHAAADLPDLPIYQRFAVQWMAQDNFGIHAFENRTGEAAPVYVSAADPQRRLPGVPGRGGVLALLGDDSVDLPMLAEVYTWPTDPAVTVDLQIESEVTAASCGREVLGELLLSQAGTVKVTDLSMAMPDCDGVGDVLVLNNPVADMKLALVE
ncbi:hypothetical protein [Szabonella alba]|uniref:Uncharacterized protein n=1 Tax=Szabonella alba TaxID=2804194 RepID=A0A8K0VAN5_9RHOB|nr:hypothetical protein [Szabonella alba]MBL4915762.1 hypothetical protein [Szabonella alba]